MPGFKVSAKLIGKQTGFFDTKEFKRAVGATNQKFAKRLKRDFGKTTRTFDFPVTFHQQTSSREMTVEVYTTNEIYFYLDKGTSIRYAVMTADYSPKTRPGALDSYPGGGRVAYFDFENPREGIEARRFSELIAEKAGPDYARKIERDLSQAHARSNT